MLKKIKKQTAEKERRYEADRSILQPVNGRPAHGTGWAQACTEGKRGVPEMKGVGEGEGMGIPRCVWTPLV